MNIDGVWRLRFLNLENGNLVGDCGGIVLLDSSVLRGGDAWSSYRGSYETHGNQFIFRLQLNLNHKAGAHHFFGPAPELSFQGKGLIDRQMDTIDATTAFCSRPKSMFMTRFGFISNLPDVRAAIETSIDPLSSWR